MSEHPSAPVTARGRAAAQSLLDVHDGLRAELRQVQSLLGEVIAGRTDVAGARGELQRLALRRHAWTTGAYCSAHCLAVAQHHFGEDTEIFPLLLRAQPALAPTLDRLRAEHLTIHDLLEHVDTALVALATGSAEQTAELRSLVTRFGDTLLAHLTYEEQELLGPMAEVFG